MALCLQKGESLLFCVAEPVYSRLRPNPDRRGRPVLKSCLLLCVASSLAFSGCVATQYEKSVTVRKDADGKILERVETERVVQPGQQGWPVKFEYLKGVIPNEK